MFSNNTKELQVFLLKITYMRHHFFNWDSLQVGLNSHYDAWKKRNTKTLKHTGNLFRKNNFYLSHPRETELWKTNFHRNIKSNNAVFPCIQELKFRKCEDKFSTRIILAKTYEYQYLQIWQTLWKKVTLISKVTLIGHGSYENFSFLCMVIAFSFLKMLRQLVWRLILRWKNVLDWKKCQISMYSEVFSPYKHALAALFRK